MLIIERPIITEKSLAKAQEGVYTFAVAPRSPKSEIAKALEKLYNVSVFSVRIQSVKGKQVRRKTGIGKERDWKKALVTVKAGQTIKDFELEQPKEEKEEKKNGD